jgi:hypothetical protein
MKYFLFAALLIPFTELFTAPPDTLESTLNEISFSFEADVSNRYVYRGLVYGNNIISQPAVSFGFGNFTAGVSGNFDMPHKKKSLRLNEIDLFVSYGVELNSFTLNNYGWMYIYTGTDPYPATAEYVFEAAYSTANFQFYSDLTVDIAEYPGAFIVSHGAAYSYTISKKLAFDILLSFAWSGSKYNEVNTGFDKSALNYSTIDMSLTWYAHENVYLQPHFQYNRLIDSRLREYIDKESSFFGILTGYTF